MATEASSNLISDQELVGAVDEMLDRFLADPDREIPESLAQAVRYAVFGGGKRIRPLLCLRACIAVGGNYKDALPAACALELIHTFSLVHDDLPAMDDDDLRRGRPTLHKHTSEAMAILAGDAMTAMAFELITDHCKNPKLAVKLISQLAEVTGAMIHGQVYDTMGGLDPERRPIQNLRYVHHLKTGQLIIGALTMGAHSGGAHEDQVLELASFGHSIGQMFQAVDDLLDVTQSTEKMGKATGKDAEQGKLTYPGLLGIDGTQAEIDSLLKHAIDVLNHFDAKADPLREMAKKLATRQK